ncbi:LysR family transcriptional regulator [Pseudonocardia humida]|uniref:LysR family transcriptional regulator n=1 Tax=Pseudonocardia humida TaxID=2800819 RepID=A0ABT1A0E7_9PSEU|nr:LysR family transcriptional regulator [Pseudonocardia humida]MCO1656375.1 LysR family transcriptional regulator [Pseudonocardia humida]
MVDLLRHVRFFVAIAEERQFGFAARRIGISQPPLSRGLQRLEAELGVRLFDRGPQGVDLTEAGAALLPHAHRLLQAEQTLRQAARGEAAGRSGVRLGVVPQLPLAASARLASTAAARAPGRARGGVTLHTASTTALVEAVAEGRLDVAVVVHPAVLGSLAAGAVVRLPTALLVPHPVARGAPARLRELIRVPLAVPPREDNPPAHDLLVDTLDEHGVTAGTTRAADERAAVALAATGRACVLTADPAVGAAGVLRVPVPGDVLPLRLRVVAPGGSPGERPPELVAALTAALVEPAGTP